MKGIRMSQSVDTDGTDEGLLPPTPRAPVRSYYRCPRPSKLWVYYNGETWVGKPRELPWYRTPIPFMRGRPEVWTYLLIAVIEAVAIIATTVLK